jgi:cardiolipin synthase
VTQPAGERAPPPATDALARALDRTAGSRAIPGNAVRALADGPEIFPAIEALIDGAARWVHFENYIVKDDATGMRFADRLLAAAARGVRVRVLYDSLGCRGTGRRFWRRLRSGGVVVRAFHRLNPLRPLRSLRRDHRKYVAADGIRAVTGGFCFGDEWAGDPGRGIPPWRDTGVEVCGPAALALEHSFLRVWAAAGGEPAPEQTPGAADECGDAVVRVVEGLPGRWRMARVTQLLAASAAERIWITEPYLVAWLPETAALASAARDGVDVRLLLPGRTDIPAIRALARVGYRQLLNAGVRIWEWQGPMIHAKTTVVDDRWLKVGSSNLNPSSLAANYELDLLVDGRQAAQQAGAWFLRDLGHAVEIVLRPSAVARRLPPAVVPAVAVARPSLAGRRERSHRAVLTLRQVASGARRSIAGAVLFTALGSAALFLALPRVMAWVVATASFLLALGAARHILARRRGD